MAIFIVPILYLFNAFFLGRLIKRFKISANSLMCTIVGFFAFFTIFYFINIFIYVANGNIWTYIIFFAVIQALLLIAYIVNWKRTFITFSVNWKKIITFVSVAALTILISWLCLRDFNSQFGTNWIKTISDLPPPDLNNVISFKTDVNDIISNFSSLNIFNVFWINCFKISNFDQCLTFCNWSWIICGGIIMGCIATWIFPEDSKTIKMIFSPIICLCYLVVILAFIESFAITDTWIMILVFVYVLMLIKKSNNSALKLFFLTTLLLSFLAINCTSFYIVICLWIFSVYWAVRNGENSVQYLVWLSWPVILIIFSLASIALYWLLALVNAICLALAIILFIYYVRKGSPAITDKFARSIYKNSTKVVYSFIGIMIALILVANFFIFHEKYHWQASAIDYKNFLTFTYRYIWTTEISKDSDLFIINGLLYAFFLALIIMFIVVRNMKRSALYPIAKKDSSIKLAVAAAAFFINPLVIHMLNIFTSNFQVSLALNTLDLNILFVAPLFISLLRLNYNLGIRKSIDWQYDWY